MFFYYKYTMASRLEIECDLKRFKVCAVYPKVRPFWIYTTISFFKTFSVLPMYVCVKIFSILKKYTYIYTQCQVVVSFNTYLLFS